MKNETDRLKERLAEIHEILLELEFLRGDIKYLITANESSHKQIVSKSRFFYRLHRNYIRLFVIDTYKLIGKREDFNLHRTLEFCKINRNKIEWHQKISLDKLNTLSEKINIVSQKFSDIQELRNKHYAHRDKNKDSFPSNVTLVELWEVLDSLQEVFRELNVDFDNMNWFFSLQYREPNIISEIDKYRRLRTLIHNEFSDKKESINTDKLAKILFDSHS